eukprot:CAMPEP_0201648412 /NCGR_PEP_ID=MMETSP0493-20130528/37568_1 /ASSEMBLY_ACC=CAM_ASM_000838 /TAXON_ID=420259 /ORGANISM="Thalassiosira gravida, Strain GMp14c1" /LENGTH=37 /DNA_ID= /DNA_START= /DNA_END= /DNA_ORIENTATION=
MEDVLGMAGTKVAGSTIFLLTHSRFDKVVPTINSLSL